MSKVARHVFRFVFRPLGAATCLCTALPLSRSRAWWVRVMDFPRLQLAGLGALTLVSGFLARRTLGPADRWLLGSTAVAVLAQLAQFAKYTPLMPRQVMRVRPARGATVSILTANVRMRNPSAEQVLKLVELRQPDLVLLLEPDERWGRQLQPLHGKYPHRVLVPLANTYGLMLFSRLPLRQPEVRFLVHRDVPSIRTRVRMRNGEECWFYGLHPRPPVRGNLEGEVELLGSAPRDAELVLAAMEMRELREPVIVAGDFNDVAWSRTTRRFQRLSGALDPRAGRGLYATYHAGHRLLRFPLDHLFVSEHFAISEFVREADIGSDHFPLYAELVMSPAAARQQEAPAPESEDFREAKEDIAAAAGQ